MRIVVTGASGQVSRSLMERTRARRGVDLIAIGRPTLNLERLETVAPSIEAASPDILVNAGAYTAVDAAEEEPERAFATNSAGAAEVASSARRLGVPLIQLSTDYVFDGRSTAAYSEDAETGPLNVYGRSKLQGERFVREANSDHLILRTAWIYSPFGSNFLKTMLRLAGERDEVSVVDDQLGSPTSALDLADAILSAAEAISLGKVSLGKTFHAAGPERCSWADFAEAIFDVSAANGGPSAKVRRIRTSEFPAKAVRPANSSLDSSVFEREFGLSMAGIRTSLQPVVHRICR